MIIGSSRGLLQDGGIYPLVDHRDGTPGGEECVRFEPADAAMLATSGNVAALPDKTTLAAAAAQQLSAPASVWNSGPAPRQEGTERDRT